MLAFKRLRDRRRRASVSLVLLLNHKPGLNVSRTAPHGFSLFIVFCFSVMQGIELWALLRRLDSWHPWSPRYPLERGLPTQLACPS